MASLAQPVAGDSLSTSAEALLPAQRTSLIRVLIADLHAVALLHVRAMLAGARDVTVVAESAPAHSAALAVRLGPDVIITEMTDSDAHGLATIRGLAGATARARVLVVSARPEAEWLLAALDAGASGAVSAHATRSEVLTAVRAVMNGQIVLHRSAVRALTARAREVESTPGSAGGESFQKLARLTGREQSVFRMTAEGYSAPEVGARLLISKKTVETYKKRIGEKLGFSHRSDYVRFALQVAVLSASRAQMEE